MLDSNSITFDRRYQGVHAKGEAEEPFDLVVCAVHPPDIIFETGKELKEYVRGIADPDEEYIVTLGQFIATQDAACGSLEVSVTIND